MSDDGSDGEPQHGARAVAEIDGMMRKVQFVVQCTNPISLPTEEEPDAPEQYCLQVLIAEPREVSTDAEHPIEIAIECPACSARMSAASGAQVKAMIPIAILVGAQVVDTLEAEDEESNDSDETAVVITADDQPELQARAAELERRAKEPEE